MATPQGVVEREDIERETDRVYFASWPHTLAEAEWLRDKLGELVENIPTPPPPAAPRPMSSRAPATPASHATVSSDR